MTSMYRSASEDSHGSPRKKMFSDNCVKTVTRWNRSELRAALAGMSIAELFSIDGEMDAEFAVPSTALLSLF